jgi:4-hydroxybenzoate polyprenyltransferase/phosphoserine phosphatase
VWPLTADNSIHNTGDLVIMSTNTQPYTLCVDLDRTLIDSDFLWESVVRTVARSPLRAIAMAVKLVRGHFRFDRQLAGRQSIDITTLTFNPAIVAMVQAARARGETTVLITESPETYAHQMATHLPLFDTVLVTGSEDGALSGNRKAQLLVDRYGEQGFAYAGSSSDDLVVWTHAGRAILVDAEASLSGRLELLGMEHERISTRTFSLKTWARQLRLYHWVKNLLVFVPLVVTLGQSNLTDLNRALLVFVAFSLLASASYICNDLSDLDSDRGHAIKRFRPLASGKISIPQALITAAVLAVGAFFIAAIVSPTVVGVLVLYALVTLSYSAYFKKVVIADVIILAGLYTSRVIAGCAALGVIPSIWLLLFSVFIFFSLALMKRCADLVNQGVKLSGRGYVPGDERVLIPLGTSSGIGSVLVLGLYMNSFTAATHYQTPALLWLLVPMLLFWISRAWILTARGKMRDDPVLFAIRDKVSLGTGIGLILITLAATVLSI